MITTNVGSGYDFRLSFTAKIIIYKCKTIETLFFRWFHTHNLNWFISKRAFVSSKTDVEFFVATGFFLLSITVLFLRIFLLDQSKQLNGFSIQLDLLCEIAIVVCDTHNLCRGSCNRILSDPFKWAILP